MANYLWKVTIRNPKTGITETHFSIKSTGTEAESAVVEKLEDTTPIEDLPETADLWDVNASLISEVE